MNLISPSTGYLFLLLFGAAMIGVTYAFSRARRARTKEAFLVARRDVHWAPGGASIAASWIWAGALFVSVQMAYEKGLPGIFWFTVPNVIALAIFALLGTKIRDRFVNGFTLPQFIRHRLKDDRVHKLYLVPFFFNQLAAITFNVAAGGLLIALITGIPVTVVMPAMVVIALAYTLISGLEASVITDAVEMFLIVTALVLLVPWSVSEAGGWSAVSGGLAGVSGKFGNVFDPSVAFSFGIVTSIGLISQTICDQQYWQRTFALRRPHIPKAFLFGAFLFALVPIFLSALGFMGANGALGIGLPDKVDPSLIGVLTLDHLLPRWAVVLFVIAILSGLSSTVDSGLSATSSLWATDVARYSGRERDLLEKQSRGEELSADEEQVLGGMDRQVIKQSRLAMVGMAVLGLAVAYAAHLIAGFGLKQLFLLSISIVACVSVPTVLALYWQRLSARGVFWGALIAMVVGMPLFFWADTKNDATYVVLASAFMIGVSTLFCLAMPAKSVAR